MADEKTFTQADLDAAIAKAVGPLNESISKLEDKNTELVAGLRKARTASEIKPEDLAAAEDRADKAETALAESKKAVTELTKRAEKAEKSLESEQDFTQKLLIQDGLKSALIANGVKDEDFIDTLTAKFASTAAVVVEGDARVAKIGDKSVADAIKEWAASDTGKKFVAAPLNHGGGALGGKGGSEGTNNPFAKETTNLTEQARLFRENPEQAKQLAQAAGVNIAA